MLAWQIKDSFSTSEISLMFRKLTGRNFVHKKDKIDSNADISYWAEKDLIFNKKYFNVFIFNEIFWKQMNYTLTDL